MHTDFATSEFKALVLGYQKVIDARAYGGVYYLKDNKRWIFNLPALSRALGISTPQEFAAAGYAIEDFLLYNHMSTEEMVVAVFGKYSPEYEKYCHVFAEEDN